MKIEQLQAKALRAKKWEIRKEIWSDIGRYFWKNKKSPQSFSTWRKCFFWASLVVGTISTLLGLIILAERPDAAGDRLTAKTLLEIAAVCLSVGLYTYFLPDLLATVFSDKVKIKRLELTKIDRSNAIINFLEKRVKQTVEDLIGPKTAIQAKRKATVERLFQARVVKEKVELRVAYIYGIPDFLLEAKRTMASIVAGLEEEQREQEKFLAKMNTFQDEILRQVRNLRGPLTDLELMEEVAKIKAESQASAEATKRLIEEATQKLEEQFSQINLEMKTKFGDLGERISLMAPEENQPRQTVQVMESAIKHCLRQAER